MCSRLSPVLFWIVSKNGSVTSKCSPYCFKAICWQFCNRANSPYSHCFCILGAQTNFIKQIRIKRACKLFMLRFPQPIAKEQNEMCAVSSVRKGSIKHMMKWNGYVKIEDTEHTASLLNSEYQVKISIQTILEHLLWFIACEGEGNETAATVNNSNIPTVQERGRSLGEGRSRKRFGDNHSLTITNKTPFIQTERSMNTTTLFEYIMADSIFGTKPATTSRAMGRLIDLFGKLNGVPNSNRSRG